MNASVKEPNVSDYITSNPPELDALPKEETHAMARR